MIRSMKMKHFGFGFPERIQFDHLKIAEDTKAEALEKGDVSNLKTPKLVAFAIFVYLTCVVQPVPNDVI